MAGFGAAALTAGCTSSPMAATGRPGSPSSPDSGPAPASPTASATPTEGVPIGDGSMTKGRIQPNQPKPVRMAPGETPPQFVVFSWDGAGEMANGLMERFLKVAEETGAAMTLFTSGIYFLPKSRAKLYRPPHHPVGASAIGYFEDADVHRTIETTGKAWLQGHEIGTHFNGHFCGSSGVARWSPADWLSEIAQAKSFLANWKTNTGFTDLPALPFDYDTELIGGRTPCLEGWRNLQLAAKQLHWAYDSSSTGTQVWPTRKNKLWQVHLQGVPFTGHKFEVLTMDYNFMANQSKTTKGDPKMRPTWQKQVESSLYAGFERAYTGNRAPLIIGNHLNSWNGGIYMNAIENTMRRVAKAGKDVRLVSFRQLIQWLEAQDPQVIAKLQTLRIGEKPKGGWAEFLGPVATATPSDSSGSTPGASSGPTHSATPTG
jgi:hypothetical protein